MLSILKWLAITLLMLAMALLAVSNRHSLSIYLHPLPFEISMPVYLSIILAFLGGFTCAYCLYGLSALRNALTLRRSRKEKEALQEEVSHLRHRSLLPHNHIDG